jgi:hypothetical protein
MVDLDEGLWRHVGKAASTSLELFWIEQRARSCGDGCVDLLLDRLRVAQTYHGSERRRRLSRIAEDELVGLRDERLEKRFVHVLVHVDPLDAAARLAGVVVGAVDEVDCRPRELGVSAHIRGILASELQGSSDETLRGGLLDRVSALDRAGECDERDAGVADDVRHSRMIEMQYLQSSVR